MHVVRIFRRSSSSSRRGCSRWAASPRTACARSVAGARRPRTARSSSACSPATGRSTSCTSRSTPAASSCWRCTSRWPSTCARSSSAVKINTDLERVGDLAVNIAEAVEPLHAASAGQGADRHPADGRHRPGDAARRARCLRAARHRAGAGGAERGRRARRAEDAGLPRAADLHAPGSGHHRAGARPDPDLPPPRADRRPRHQRRRGRHLHGLGPRRPAPRRRECHYAGSARPVATSQRSPRSVALSARPWLAVAGARSCEVRVDAPSPFTIQ